MGGKGSKAKLPPVGALVVTTGSIGPIWTANKEWSTGKVIPAGTFGIVRGKAVKRQWRGKVEYRVPVVFELDYVAGGVFVGADMPVARLENPSRWKQVITNCIKLLNKNHPRRVSKMAKTLNELKEKLCPDADEHGECDDDCGEDHADDMDDLDDLDDMDLCFDGLLM